jgi:hypothetical protein
MKIITRLPPKLCVELSIEVIQTSWDENDAVLVIKFDRRTTRSSSSSSRRVGLIIIAMCE